MANIGVFFCTEDEILTHMYERHDGKQQGVIFNPPEGHDRVWRNKFEKEHREKYDFWPIGRVSYNTNSRQYIIYHDKCLGEDVLEKVRVLFNVPEEGVRYVVDDYYSCQECRKKIIDDDENLYW